MNINHEYNLTYKERVQLKKKEYKISFSIILVHTIVWVNTIIMGCILLSLFFNVSFEKMQQVINIEMFYAVLLSFASVVFSLIIVTFLGIPISYILATKVGRIYKILEILTCFPVILPPTVAGLALLMTFGKRGTIGSLLYQYGFNIPFTFIAIIITQVFIISPFFIQIVKNEFLAIDKSIIEAAKVFGADEKDLIVYFYIPLAKKGIISGLVLCLLRGLAEFGATIMFAGNMVFKTQTLSLRIYSLYQFDIIQAVNLAVIQVIIVFAIVLLMKILLKNYKEV